MLQLIKLNLQNQVEQSNNQRKILPKKQIPPKGKIQIEPLNKSTSLFKEIIHKREALDQIVKLLDI